MFAARTSDRHAHARRHIDLPAHWHADIHPSTHARTHARTHTHTHTRRAYMHEQDSVVGEDMRWSRLRFCLRFEKGRADVMVMEMAIGIVVGGQIDAEADGDGDRD